MLKGLIWKIRAPTDGRDAGGAGKEGGSSNSRGITNIPCLSPIPSLPSPYPRPRKRSSWGSLKGRRDSQGFWEVRSWLGRQDIPSGKHSRLLWGCNPINTFLSKIWHMGLEDRPLKKQTVLIILIIKSVSSVENFLEPFLELPNARRRKITVFSHKLQDQCT